MGYICIECGRTFEDPGKEVEYHEGFGGSAREVFDVCPHCESENFEETVTCKICGEETGKSQAAYGLCADCEIAAGERFKRLLNVDYAVASWVDATNAGTYRCVITNTLNGVTAVTYSNECVATTAA